MSRRSGCENIFPGRATIGWDDGAGGVNGGELRDGWGKYVRGRWTSKGIGESGKKDRKTHKT